MSHQVHRAQSGQGATVKCGISDCLEILSGEVETMSLFQIFAGLFAILCFLWCVCRCLRGPGRYARVVNGLLAIVWLSACTLIMKPKLASVVAGILGIGRGTDLVLYVFVIVAVLYSMFIYYRLCDLLRDITLIVRHIAITEHQIPAKEGRVEPKESNVVQKHGGRASVMNSKAESEEEDG